MPLLSSPDASFSQLLPRVLLAALLPCALLAAPVQAEIPKVALSEQHRAMCKVGVGDALPRMTLKTPNGDDQRLDALYSDQATVVVFYRRDRTDRWMTRALLADLPPDVAERFGPRGTTVIAIGVGKAADAKPPALKGCLSLVDEQAEALAEVGEGKLPRVYVLDKDKKIAWFDIEYSNSTRRELRQTLASLVGEGTQAVAEAPRDAR